MTQNQTSKAIATKFYIRIAFVSLAFLGLLSLVFLTGADDTKFKVSSLNFKIQIALKENIAQIKNDLLARANLIKSLGVEGAADADKEGMQELYEAFYVVSGDKTAIFTRKFQNAHELKSFDMPWLDALKTQNFAVSFPLFKNANFSSIYVAFKIDGEKFIVAELNRNFFKKRLENVAQKSESAFFLADGRGEILTREFSKGLERDFIKDYAADRNSGDTKVFFCFKTMSFNAISYVGELGIFVATSSLNYGAAWVKILILAFSALCFAAFVISWAADARFAKRRVLEPLSKITDAIKERKIAPADDAAQDVAAIMEGVNALISELEGAKETARYYKDKYGYIFEQSPLIICTYDAYTGEPLDVSEAALKFYGYSREEALKLNIKDVIPAPYSEIFAQRNVARESGEAYLTQHKLKNGETRDMRVIVHQIRVRDERINFVVAFDVTAQEASKRNNETAQRYFSLSPSVVMEADAHEPYLIKSAANNANEAFGVYGRENFKAFDIRKLICERDLNEFIRELETRKRLFENSSEAADNFNAKLKMLDARGEPREYKILVKFIKDAGRQIDKIVYVATENSEYAKLLSKYENELKNRKNILWATSAVPFSWEEKDEILRADDEFAKMLGFDAGELGELNFANFSRLLADGFNSFKDTFNALKAGDGEYAGLIKFYAKDKSAVFIEIRARAAQTSEDGEAIAIRGAFLNARQKARAFVYEDMLSKIFSYCSSGAIIADTAWRIIDVNDAFLHITSQNRDEILGKEILEAKIGVSDSETQNKIAKILEKEGFWQDKFYNVRNGQNALESVSIATVKDYGGQTLYYLIMVSSVSDMKANQEYLQYVAYHDPLTKLPNRFLFSRKLEAALTSGRKIAVAYLDMDGFKGINDTYGHQAGDKFLTDVSSGIDKLFEERDMFARLGGDEFAAIIVYKNAGEIYELAENMLRIASGEVEFEDIKLQISASVGISIASSGVSAEDLLERADWAMYQAKLAGKNRYYVFDASKDRHLKKQYDDGSKIQKALENNEFFLEYQPEIDVKTGEILSFEALIRWNKDGKTAYPDEFLPLIKKQRIIDEISLFSVKKALEARAASLKSGREAKICVNLSIEQLLDEEFFLKFSEIFSESENLGANALYVDIVESNEIKDLQTAAEFLRRYKKLGVSFFIDDFASATSAFEALGILPVSGFKVDKNLSGRILDSKATVATTSVIKQLSNAFSAPATIKNIEDKRTLEILARLGFTRFQGNYFTKPVSLEAAMRFKFNAAINLEPMDAGEFQRFKDCVELKEYARAIVTHLKRGGEFLAREEILQNLEHSKNSFTKIVQILIKALNSKDGDEMLLLAGEADLACDEILNKEGR